MATGEPGKSSFDAAASSFKVKLVRLVQLWKNGLRADFVENSSLLSKTGTICAEGLPKNNSPGFNPLSTVYYNATRDRVKFASLGYLQDCRRKSGPAGPVISCVQSYSLLSYLSEGYSVFLSLCPFVQLFHFN